MKWSRLIGAGRWCHGDQVAVMFFWMKLKKFWRHLWTFLELVENSSVWEQEQLVPTDRNRIGTKRIGLWLEKFINDVTIFSPRNFISCDIIYEKFPTKSSSTCQISCRKFVTTKDLTFWRQQIPFARGKNYALRETPQIPCFINENFLRSFQLVKSLNKFSFTKSSLEWIVEKTNCLNVL